MDGFRFWKLLTSEKALDHRQKGLQKKTKNKNVQFMGKRKFPLGKIHVFLDVQSALANN